MISKSSEPSLKLALYFVFQLLLSLILCYGAFVSVYLSFLKNKHFDFLTVFFVFTLVLFALIFLYQIYQTFKEKGFYPQKTLSEKIKNPVLFMRTIKKNKKLLILLTLCFISFLVGFFNVYSQYSRTPASPEIYQSFSYFYSSDAMRESYRQQQPPLDYYFSAFSNQLWGKGKFSIRFHAMVFYLILSLVLPLILYFFCSSLWAVGFGSFLFSINHVIRLHSVNGRPLSLALFLGFLFLFFYMSYCKYGDNQFGKSGNRLFPVIASQYLFVLSIGFQPVIFIVCLFLSSFLLLFQNKKEIFKKLFLSHIVTALFSLPFYIKMYLYGQSAHKFKEPSFKKLSFYIEDYNILNLFKEYFYPFYEQLFPFLAFLFCGLGIVIFIQRKMPSLIIQVGTALVIFPLLFDFLFKMIINWGVWSWYFIVWSLFLIFFFVLALNEVFDYLKRKRQVFLFLLIPAGVLFLYNSYSQILFIQEESRFWYPYRSNDAERVYDYLKEKANTNDIFIEITLSQPSSIREGPLENLRFFFYESKVHPLFKGHHRIEVTQTPPFIYEQTSDTVFYVEWEKVPKKENQKIFFIVSNDDTEKDDKAHFALSSFLKEQKIGKLSVFEWIFKTRNREKEYKEFLIHLLKKTPRRYQAALYETLLYYACKNKRKNKFKKLLKEYRKLEPFLEKPAPGKMNPPYRFALRRRAKFFKYGNYCKD